MQAKNRSIHVAYSLSLKNGKNHFAAAYIEESGFAGLPANHVFRHGYSVWNDTDSAHVACRKAVARLLRDNPEFSDCRIFEHGRQPESSVSAAPVFAFHGKNRDMGVASEYVKESANG